MAFNLLATGVRVATGRGASAVVLDISFAEIEAWAKRQSIDTGRLMDRSFGRAVSGLRKQLVKVMRQGGGVCGVPRFKDYEAFTAEYRRAVDRDPTGPIGGVLADERRIVAYKRNGWQEIGWPDKMMRVARNFQEGRGGSEAQAWLENEKVRRWVHKNAEIDYMPTVYVNNRRMVLRPYFLDNIKANLDVWARTIFYKGLVKQMQKTGGPK